MSRILGIDYGERRVGLALSDPMQILARPYITLDRKDKGWMGRLMELIHDQEVTKIVVGYPLNMKGVATAQTKLVDLFIEDLKGRVGVGVETYDERLSSQAAIRSLHEQGVKTGHDKGAIDMTAAAIFLQDYLDAHASTS